jgi:hypothetical protein
MLLNSVFQTGEIWSIDTSWLSYPEHHLPFIEERFNMRFTEYARFLEALGVTPPYHWAAGVTGVKGRQLDVPVPPGYVRLGRHNSLCLSETIEAEGRYESGQAPSEAMRPFYEKIFEKCGVERSADLQ